MQLPRHCSQKCLLPLGKRDVLGRERENQRDARIAECEIMAAYTAEVPALGPWIRPSTK
jgi:hypothetical protein